MLLEICVQSYFYQIRFCWMLSSILQQESCNMDILITTSYSNDRSKPDGIISNLAIIDYFTNLGLNIRGYSFEQSQLLDRTFLRNLRAKDTLADWVLYADADMVYSRNFFQHLHTQLISDEYKDNSKILGADRISLDIDFCEKYIQSQQINNNPFYIENPTEILKTFPIRGIGGGKIAPGYFQLINGNTLRKTGIYCHRNMGFRADKEARRIYGKSRIEVLPQYHLNHYRNTRWGAVISK